jgi:UDP-glucose 4-epimerase
MRVLVTGGNGFIGAHILNQLVDRGHEVTNLDISEPSPIAAEVGDEVTFLRGDITDPVDVYDAVVSADPDRIVHMAALLGRPCERDPLRAFEVNVEGSLNVLEAAVTCDVERVVAAASMEVYGTVDDGTERLTEQTPRTPDSVYGMTKYVLEYLGSTYGRQHDLEFAAMEPAHGLGPDRLRGNVDDAFVVKAAVAGDRLTVPALEYPYEVIYIEDEARAFVEAALADDLSHDRYLVGTGEQVTLAEFVESVNKRVGRAELELASTESDMQLGSKPPINASRLRRDLGWEPTHTVEEAIDAYVEWLEENPDAWSFDPSNAPWNEP